MTHGECRRDAVLRIGGVVIRPAVLLAPMAGYTDAAFRLACREFGCGAALTEVTNAAGLVQGSKRTMHLLETMPGERPVGAHLYGSDPSILAEAARRVSVLGRFDFVDLNCGCPVRRIVARGAGAGLLRDPAKIGRIVRAMSEATSLPVTVKTRIGLERSATRVSEVAHAVEVNGGSALFVHARYAEDRHAGTAHWDALAQLADERTIPIVGNGGLDSPVDVVRMFAETGVDGAMVGRAAIGNPWFFRRAAALLCRLADPGPPPVSEVRAVAARHLDRLVALKTRERSIRRRVNRPAEEAAVLHFRAQLLRYVAGRPGVGRVRRRMQQLRTVADAVAAIDDALALDGTETHLGT